MLFAPILFPQDTQTDEAAIFELSPFTVEADSDIGYMATNTLAGSRLKTELRDVASAIETAQRLRPRLLELRTRI